MLTGDPYYLDGLQLWASYFSMWSAQDCGPGSRCGPYAMIGDTVRGSAWLLRERTNAWLMSPDDDPMKAIFSDMLDDALALWEGERGITGTKYQDTFLWKQRQQYVGKQDVWGNLGPPPLHWWTYVGTPVTDLTVYNPAVAGGGNLMWQQSFLIIALGRAVELGFDAAKPLFAWAAENLIGQMTDPDYNPHLAFGYVTLSFKKGPAHFTSWKETMTGYADAYKSTTNMGYWPAAGSEIYWDVARGAVGISAGLHNADLAWTRFGEVIAAKIKETGQAPNWNLDPTWAIIPRK